MKARSLFSLFILFLTESCKLHPVSGGSVPGENKTYRLRLNPPIGSTYHYKVKNEQYLDEEVDDKEIKNEKTTDVGAVYGFSRDSAGNIILNLSYDEIKMRTKNGDDVTEEDAANGPNSIDPVERMLALLKDVHIVATATPAGAIISVKGYQAIAGQMLAGVGANADEKAKVRIEWRQLVEQGIIHKNMEQLFKLFPDSAVHVGEKWKIFSTDTSELTFNVKNFFTLKSIQDGVARVETNGVINTDSSVANLMGVDVASEIAGTQEGSYSIDVKTGMLIGAEIGAVIDGTMQVSGRTVKVKIRTNVKIVGQRLKLPKGYPGYWWGIPASSWATLPRRITTTRLG